MEEKKISELTPTHIDAISSTWALRLNRPIEPYRMLLQKLVENKKPIDEFPYFIISAIKELGYEVNIGVSDAFLSRDADVILLNWMDGSRSSFKTIPEARAEFEARKTKAIKNNEELDLSCFKIVSEYNNID